MREFKVIFKAILKEIKTLVINSLFRCCDGCFFTGYNAHIKTKKKRWMMDKKLKLSYSIIYYI